MLKRFCTYYKPHLKIFTADMAAAFLLSVCTMIYPLITRQMLIDFIPNREVKLLVIWAAVLLGIYLVKNIMVLHGETIDVESEPGKYTKFTFTLTPSKTASK